MKKRFLKFATIFLLALLLQAVPRIQGEEKEQENAGTESRLAVLWTSGDPDVAHKVCFMYTHAAKKYKWFDEVLLIVWGPSSRLLVGDRDLQAKIRAMMEDGIKIQACIVCADSYGVTEQLRALRIEVKPMGLPLSNMIKGGWHTLTF